MEQRRKILAGEKNESKEAILTNAALTASQILIEAQHEAEHILEIARVKASKLFEDELQKARLIRAQRTEEAKEVIDRAIDHVEKSA